MLNRCDSFNGAIIISKVDSKVGGNDLCIAKGRFNEIYAK